MSIHGIGCDLLEVSRVQAVYERFGDKFIRRVLTPTEIAQAQQQSSPVGRFAKYMAAKEAAFKALNVGRDAGISWQHFEVTYAPSGAPNLCFYGAARATLPKLFTAHLSLSDTQSHAMAYVVIEVL
jgi:holo-[acyl-carrier protein] synthase